MEYLSPSIAASDDGRFWAVGNPNYVFPGANTYQQPQSVIFKSACNDLIPTMLVHGLEVHKHQ